MFIAVRSNERAASAVGIDVARTKLLAFGLSAFIAGLGGGLFAYSQQTISPPSFARLHVAGAARRHLRRGRRADRGRGRGRDHALEHRPAGHRAGQGVQHRQVPGGRRRRAADADRDQAAGRHRRLAAAAAGQARRVADADGARRRGNGRRRRRRRAESMRVSLDHAGLSVADLDAAVAFYGRVFGFEAEFPFALRGDRAGVMLRLADRRAAGAVRAARLRRRAACRQSARTRSPRAATGTSRSTRRTSTRCSRGRLRAGCGRAGLAAAVAGAGRAFRVPRRSRGQPRRARGAAREARRQGLLHHRARRVGRAAAAARLFADDGATVVGVRHQADGIDLAD